MRILLLHNRYRMPGGEDQVARSEGELLVRMGHTVEWWEENNDSIEGPLRSCATALQSVFSVGHADAMQKMIRRFRPDVVHIHNFFPRFSPSVHIACRRAGTPVVQTLHNFRLLCPAATFQCPDRARCERCMRGIFPWAAVVRRCYRSSTLASLAVANMLAVHRVLNTWNRSVSRFIALSDFARTKFVAGGIGADKIAVKPNFVDPDPGVGPGRGGYALFVGRLAEEKGVGTLLAAWNQLTARPKLKVIGEGPLGFLVKQAAAAMPGIEWLGSCTREQVRTAMADATVLILPSTWYEAFPLVIAEAFAAGLPVLASRLGTMQEVIEDGKTGRLFTPGDASELATAVERIFAHSVEREAMRSAARAEYEGKYNSGANYAQLMRIYESALRYSPAPAGSASELESEVEAIG